MPSSFVRRMLDRRVVACLVAIGAASANAATPVAIDTDTLVAQAREEHREIERQVRDLERQALEVARLEIERHAEDLERNMRELDFEPGSLAFAMSEFGDRTEIVKNAPYSAEAISESVQVLADGNRIVKESRALLARDSYGRTRQERKGPNGTRVYVFDPIEGRSFALNPERRTAFRIPRVPSPPAPPAPPALPESGWPAPVAPMPPVPPVPPVPPAPPAAVPGAATPVDRVVVRRAESGRDEDVRIEVVRIAPGEPAPLGPTPLTLRTLPRGKGETKSLGMREFGGVRAEGTQTTHTIAAGAIGNEKPIIVTSERWFSPELHVVVFAKTVDPRVGETTYRLANVRREEPPAEWFKVPAGYRSSAVR